MILYSSITLLCFIQFLLTRGLSAFASKVTGFILIGIFAALAGIRGMVGTDTWQYTHIIKSIGNGAFVPLEPGFYYLAKIFTSLTDDATLAVNSFSILFFAFAVIYVLRATRTEMIYFFAYFAPQSFIMYSFNGLRVGIATMVFILALQFWRREKRVKSLGLLLFAVSFHYTIILAITIYFLFIEPLRRRRYLLQKLLTLTFIGAMVVLLNDYLLDKKDSYSTFGALSPLAGISYLIKLPLLMTFIWKLPVPRNEIRSKFYLSMGLLGAGLLLSFQSYAGLRILNIIDWLVPLLFIYSVKTGENVGSRFHSGLALVGFVGALGVLRNIAGSTQEAVGSQSPFLPYHFMWETGP